MLQNWHHYAKQFLSSNDQLVVVAESSNALNQLNSSFLSTPFVLMDASGNFQRLSVAPGLSFFQAPFGSNGFARLTGRRPHHILGFLQQGCTVLYSDIDTAWTHNIFEDIAASGRHALYLTDDSRNNVSHSTFHSFCTCLLYVQPTPEITRFVQEWAALPVGQHGNDQYTFNRALAADHNTTHSVDFAQLPFDKFPPGCRAKDFPMAHVLHANWRIGLEKKIGFLQAHGFWHGGSP